MLRVRAQLEGVDGEVSAAARFETLAALPGPPRSLRLVARADRTVTLEWTAPADPCGPLAPLHAYVLEYAELRERRPAAAAAASSSSASSSSGSVCSRAFASLLSRPMEFYFHLLRLCLTTLYCIQYIHTCTEIRYLNDTAVSSAYKLK